MYMVSVSLLVIYLSHLIYKFYTFNEIIVDLSDKNFDFKTRYKREDLPPHYPNGWFSVLESRDLGVNQIKPISAFGVDLVVYRELAGKVHVVDAYCPHLGANLGIGGRVVGDSVRCPFHGWTFNGAVRIKVWECVEENGFIFVWHHSDHQKPDWFPIPIPDIRDSRLVYRGRAEHHVNCHFQEIPENGADVQHLNELHEGPEFLGTVVNRSMFYDFVVKYLRYDWTATWESCPAPDPHMAHLDLRSVYSLLGFPLMPITLDVLQIGPAIVHLKINCKLLGDINGYIIQTITPLAPLRNRIVHHFYTEPTFKAFIFSKFMIYGEARMVERDVVIWNHKKFLKQPYFAKHETPLVRFRRWFTQFYTEKCPKVEDW
ncbi:unnamed protein product [Oppiella nova]|uniref:cholesterol 7-desaturase n=1 Tax=Oppiella nova TaxID=334625 RepID=A0A7R9M5V3_9ACAR|nr:unnamed protein product [Oppiella nova]CAG2171223.1 unnamed protein product [Oppiella nova]